MKTIPCKVANKQRLSFVTCPLASVAFFFSAKHSNAKKIFAFLFQHVDEQNSYLCGYLKITGLTLEYPMLTTFFDGEIISKRYPFLTRKWDADEEVDRKHWVSHWVIHIPLCNFNSPISIKKHFRANSPHSKANMKKHLIPTISITTV